LVHWENHCSSSDPFTTTETTARENYYGVSGYPTVFIDGVSSVVGAGACGTAATAYRNAVNARIAQTDGMSPILITDNTMTVAGGNITMSATFRLVDPVPLSNLRATLLLYEDDVYYSGQYWDVTTRKIYDENITLSNIGDYVTLTKVYAVGSYNPANLHSVAYVQNTATKEVIQAQLVGHPTSLDYSLYFTKKVASVPDGNGIAVFSASLSNVSASTETLTLEPGTAFGPWTTDFLVCGDPNPHTGAFQISLAPNQVCEFQVRVHTNATREIRTGTFKVTSQSSGRLQETSLRVFNGSPSIFFVDNDASSVQVSVTNALNANSYLYDTWNTVTQGYPNFGNMNGFDIVVWHTGGRQCPLSNNTVLSHGDEANMMGVMDQGGSVFILSDFYLNVLNNVPDTFTTDYLGISTWVIDKSYLQMNGVAGDAIGNGMSLPLTYQYPSWAKGDDPIPVTALTSFTAPDGSHAMIHNTRPNNAKVVFLPGRYDAISASDPDPNNANVLMHRVIDWLKPGPAADVDPITTRMLSGIQQARPNPFNRGTEIAFSLSTTAASSPVRLEVFDIGGRMVAKVVDGVLTPGTHVRSWSGRRDDGSVARSGVYFARLTTREGTQSAKLILLK